jgi:integrase/recombinase XerD
VGEAIVEYISNGRTGDSSRALFLSAKTPHPPPFKDAQIVNTVLEDAFRKTGLKPPQKFVGSHLMRHSLRPTCSGRRRSTRSATSRAIDRA